MSCMAILSSIHRWLPCRTHLGSMLVILALIASVLLTSCDKLARWTVVNDVPFAASIWVDGGWAVYSAHEQRIIDHYFPRTPQKDHPIYTVKAYEFLPGQGNIYGKNAQGTRVAGGEGDLIYCQLYTWQELKDAKLTIVVTRNVEQPGLRPAPETSSCP